MLTDIPATISSVLNLNETFPGLSVFEIGSNEIRDRKFLYYEKNMHYGNEYFDLINVYKIKGSALDRTSWHLTKQLFGSQDG